MWTVMQQWCVFVFLNEQGRTRSGQTPYLGLIMSKLIYQLSLIIENRSKMLDGGTT